jgi:hypothetical protein
MATLKEITYNILNVMEGGRGTNSEYYSLRQIEFNVQYYRALLLRRDAERGYIDLNQFEQEFETPLEVISAYSDNSAVDLCDLYSMLLRSSLTIPKSINLKGHYDLTWVGTANRQSVPLSRFYQLQHFKYNRFTSTGRRAYVANDRLFVVGDPGVEALFDTTVEYCIPLSSVLVRGVFADPTEVEGWQDTDEYPISLDMVQRITQSLLNGEMRQMVDQYADTELVSIPDSKDGS